MTASEVQERLRSLGSPEAAALAVRYCKTGPGQYAEGDVWDLVDASAPEIVGGYLADKSREPLDRLASSRNLWERRISIVSTHSS